MSDLFVRFQRILDRVFDGETVAAAELAAVAPLFTAAPSSKVETLAQQLRWVLGPLPRFPLGDLVLGLSGGAGVTWPCATPQVAAVLARSASLVALLGHAGDILTQEQRLGLLESLDWPPTLFDLVAVTTAVAVFPEQESTELAQIRGRWVLLAADGIPVVEMVSPYVRDVAGSIDAFAQQRALPCGTDDERYAVVDALLQQDPRLVRERNLGEASCGIRRLESGLTLIEPRALDLTAVDIRAKNPLMALRRIGLQVAVVPAERSAVESALSAAAELPEVVLVTTRAASLSADVVVPQQLRHVQGHLLELADNSPDALCAALPRQTRFAERALLASVPGHGLLREDVRNALLAQLGAVDSSAYQAALGARLFSLAELGEGNHLPLLCASASPEYAGHLAAAIWQTIQAPRRRFSRGRA